LDSASAPSRYGIQVKNILTLSFKEFPAQNGRQDVRALMMLKKLGRLFTIKTRFEAWLVIYAIALGAVERGRHYLETYPGFGGWLLALACTGVVFIAGGKLLDSVTPPKPALAGTYQPPLRHRSVTGRNRPTRLLNRRGSESRISRRTD
jgi:hypothetical protein